VQQDIDQGLPIRCDALFRFVGVALDTGELGVEVDGDCAAFGVRVDVGIPDTAAGSVGTPIPVTVMS
jgi:hypothetical protein